MPNWNEQIIEEFHAKGGRGVAQFGDSLLLLTSKGAKSGEERVTPVMYHRDGDAYVIVASKGGAPDNPAWYHNLKTHPEAIAEVGTERFPVRAREAEGEERDRLYADREKMAPGFTDYRNKTSRRIPVMLLERVS
jgi:deazaflavin-dependent oxidoreductase (nitroreductase family)